MKTAESLPELQRIPESELSSDDPLDDLYCLPCNTSEQSYTGYRAVKYLEEYDEMSQDQKDKRIAEALAAIDDGSGTTRVIVDTGASKPCSGNEAHFTTLTKGPLKRKLKGIANGLDTVSYTHLTLPTIYSV